MLAALCGCLRRYVDACGAMWMPAALYVYLRRSTPYHIYAVRPGADSRSVLTPLHSLTVRGSSAWHHGRYTPPC
jgi:hypothetical protein